MAWQTINANLKQMRVLEDFARQLAAEPGTRDIHLSAKIHYQGAAEMPARIEYHVRWIDARGKPGKRRFRVLNQ